jgi:ADP-L-glycero-D-manno-heptose 6-epimerase
VVHMGAISSTTESNVDLLMENNFRLSLRLFEWCAASRTPFIYASSAATYGDGATGFADDWSSAGLARLKPLNPYGGAARDVVGIRRGAISGNMKVSFQAARSIG